jgi:phosphohistidine phosphatase SixA
MFGEMMKSACILSVLLFFSANLAFSAETFPVEEMLATAAQIRQLRTGGYVLFIRHGNTDNSHPDRSPSVDLNDCSTQRVLNKEGVALMNRIGQDIRTAKIPIGEIIVSPLCRTKDSANLMFNAPFRVENLLMYSSNMTSEEKVPVIANTRSLLSAPVTDGKNRVLVAHAPNLMDLMKYFPKEGTLVIFKPLGNDEYEYISSIPPAHWKTLTQ